MTQPIGMTQAGGGVMGIGPARYAAGIERSTGKQLQDLFDFFAGTSAGTINCGLYACDYDGGSVLDFHHEHGHKPFADKNLAYRTVKFGPQFDDKKILALLKKYCGDRTMSETVKPFYATSWDMRKHRLKVFGPEDKDIPVWFAIRCSMAAPTYFGNMEGKYGDGGMAANDPLLVAFSGAVRHKGLDISNGMRLVNLVTSGTTPEGPAIGNNWFILRTLLEAVIPALTKGNSCEVEHIRESIDLFTKTVSAHNVVQVLLEIVLPALLKLKGVDAQELRDVIEAIALQVAARDTSWLQNFRVAPDCPDYDLADVSCVADVERRWVRQFELNRDALIPYLTAQPAKDEAGPEVLS